MLSIDVHWLISWKIISSSAFDGWLTDIVCLSKCPVLSVLLHILLSYFLMPSSSHWCNWFCFVSLLPLLRTAVCGNMILALWQLSQHIFLKWYSLLQWNFLSQFCGCKTSLLVPLHLPLWHGTRLVTCDIEWTAPLHRINFTTHSGVYLMLQFFLTCYDHWSILPIL